MSGAAGGAVTAAGVVILLIGLTDIFITVFNYDGFTFIAGRLHAGAWRVLRATSRLMPGRVRAAYLSLGSAAMVPLTLLWWLALETAGFGLLYLRGVSTGGFAVSHGATGAQGAFYLSGGDLTSLTFGDVVAQTPWYRALVDLETAIGLATFTIGLTYVLAAFDAVGSLNELHNLVRRQAVAPHKPATILERHFRNGHAEQLASLLQSLVEDLSAYDDALRRYPVVFYFHTRRSERSIPRIFTALGELIELLRWGLPPDHDTATDPYLLALSDQYDITTRRLLRSFVGPDQVTEAAPAAPDAFATATAGRTGNKSITDFHHLKATAAAAGGLPSPAAPAANDATYEQYRNWLRFHTERISVTERLRVALCYATDAVD